MRIPLITISVVLADTTHGQWNADPLIRTNVCRTATHGQYEQTMCPSDSGSVLVFWDDVRNGSSIWGQRLNAQGYLLWDSVGVNAISSTDFYSATSLAAFPDGIGGAYLIYNEGGDKLKAQRMDKMGNKRWGANGIVVRNVEFTGIQYPRATLADNGDLVIVWRCTQTDPRIEAQRLDTAGNLLWGPNALVVSPPGPDPGAREPMIATDNANGAFVVWEKAYDSLSVQRVDAGGALLFQTPSSVDLYTDYSTHADMCSDGSGGLFFAGNRGGDGVNELRLFHLSPQGMHLIPAVGIPITQIPTVPLEVKLLPDGQGGVHIGWTDWGTGTNNTVRSMRFDAGGATLWGPEPVIACYFESTEMRHLMLASDSTGGCYMAWVDQRTGHYTVYAQHVNSDGSLAWIASGHPVCIADGLTEQVEDVVISMVGKVNTPVIAWTDTRVDPDQYRVYATDLLELLSSGVTEDRMVRGVRVYPNPTSGMFHLVLDPSLGPALVEVVDMCGRHVITEWANSEAQAGLCLSGASGLYLVKVTQANTRSYSTIVLGEVDSN